MTSRLSFQRIHRAGQILLAWGLLVHAQMLAAQSPAELSDEQIKQRVEYHVMAAELAGQRGQLDFAAREYLKALELAPNAELAERATRVALYAQTDEVALKAGLIWITEQPERYEARLLVARLALRQGDIQLAHAQATALIWSHPKGVATAFRELALSMGSEPDHAPEAQKLMQRLVEEFPSEPAGHYALGMLALRQDEPLAAQHAAESALLLRPDWADAILLKITALLRQDRQREADELVERLDGEDDWMASLHMAYARLLLETEYSDAAIRQFEEALDYDDENPEALYALGLLYLNAEDYSEAYDHLAELYELQTPRQSEAAYYLGGIEESRGEYEDALEWYARVEDGNQTLDAIQRSAYSLYKLDRLSEARDLLAATRAQHSEDALRLYQVEGELLFQARAYQQAAEFYNRALEAYPDEPDLLYGRSLVSERLGRIAMAEKDLRRLLEIDPDDPRSLNALGYILSNHSRRYDEALDLISRALDQTPEDATVIDSMGWVQYRLGDLDAALRYLSEAFDKMPDPEVAAHLGEVLWHMGQRSRAQSIWREALRDDPDHPVLQETINRLTR
ncbi:MAG: tetratricopeptide repeat protein [Nevskiales bacterium]